MAFYTYLWLRIDGRPYYVGKGKGKRGFISSGHKVNRPIDKSRIIIQIWDSEDEAFEAEKFLISFYGRLDIGTGCLRNRTGGGDGTSGRIFSKETRNKISLSNRRRRPSEKTKARISLSMKANPKVKANIAKLAKLKRGWA